MFLTFLFMLSVYRFLIKVYYIHPLSVFFFPLCYHISMWFISFQKIYQCMQVHKCYVFLVGSFPLYLSKQFGTNNTVLLLVFHQILSFSWYLNIFLLNCKCNHHLQRTEAELSYLERCVSAFSQLSQVILLLQFLVHSLHIHWSFPVNIKIKASFRNVLVINSNILTLKFSIRIRTS